MERAAGLLVIKVVDDVPYILCLRVYGSYDLPKGHVEANESDLAAALREAKEEADISSVTFPWGQCNVTVISNKKKVVKLFLCTTSDVPKILPNPNTGKFEHHAVAWLTLDDAERRLHVYLRPAISWVREQLKV